MAIQVYSDADPSTGFSLVSNPVNPVRLSANGQFGRVIDTLYYVRNDDPGFTYTSVAIQPVRVSGKDIVSGYNGYSWKIISGSTQPTEAQWYSAAAAEQVSLGSLPDTVTYLPFWLRVQVPRGAPTESLDGVVLRITAEETAVP